MLLQTVFIERVISNSAHIENVLDVQKCRSLNDVQLMATEKPAKSSLFSGIEFTT